MQAYFMPDISKLREIPKEESERLLSAESEPDATAFVPDTMFVSQLLNMIRVARQVETVSRPRAA